MQQSPAELLREKFWALKKSRVRTSPCNTTRASSLGLECERQLFYEQTAWEMRADYPPELQAIFDLGIHLEDYVVRESEAMGFKVYQRGKDYIDRRYNLTGHIDAKLELPGFDKRIPAEIKGLNPFTAGQISTVDDIRNHPQAWVRKYYAQLQIYLLLDNSELGVFLLLDKCSGQIAAIDCPLDFDFAEGLLKKAERIRDAVAAKSAPDRKMGPECARCPFVAVCKPDIEFGKALELFDDPEIEEMLRKREELSKARSEFEKLDKAIKARLPKKPDLMVGEFVLHGEEKSRAGYSVEPTKFWQWSIERASPEKSHDER
jgi:hypothetical protein